MDSGPDEMLRARGNATGRDYPLEYADEADGRSEGGNVTDDEEKMEVGCGEDADMEQFAAHPGERGKEDDVKEGSHKSKELTNNTGGATVSEKAKRFIAENRVGGRGGGQSSRKYWWNTQCHCGTSSAPRSKG
jgi:hypothetical protein